MSSFVQLLCPGGTVSPSRLELFARACVGSGITEVVLSHRQSLLAVVPPGTRESVVQQLNRVTTGARVRNCMSSLWETGRPGGPGWLSEGSLLGVIDDLAAGGLQDVSLVGPDAEATPRIASRINCVASRIAHQWHIVLQRSNGDLVAAPFLVPTFALVQALCCVLSNDPAASPDDELLERMAAFASPLDHEPLPVLASRASSWLPEGVESSADGSASITILADSTVCSPEFLDELGYLARRHKAGRILFTPDHRIVVRKLPPASLSEWKELMRRRRISLQHDHYDLCWRVEPQHRTLRGRVLSALRRRRADLEGIRIALGSRDVSDGADIWIEPRARGLGLARVRSRTLDAASWRAAGRAITASGIALLIDRVISGASEHRIPGEPGTHHAAHDAVLRSKDRPPVLRCPFCETVYDPKYGDEHSGVAAGTPVADLPDHYTCAVCAAPKEQMIA